MSNIPYTITSSSLTFVLEGKTHVVQKESLNFKPLRDALLDGDVDAVKKNITVARGIETWAKGDFKVNGDQISYKGEKIDDSLNARILKTASEGGNPTNLFRFIEDLSFNTSYRSVQQLYPFLQHHNIALDEEGNILVYKAVNRNYRDFHTGTCDNSPGQILEMPRNKISDDPNEACHFGYHVGALGYASSFGSADRRILICKVRPRDVVCVPYDYTHQKMRVCRYEVIGNYSGPLSDTNDHVVVEDEDIETTLGEEIEDEDSPEEDVRPRQKTVLGDDFERSDFDRLSARELVQCSHKALRRYAQMLKIVNASKIKGGKPALIFRILEVRS